MTYSSPRRIIEQLLILWFGIAVPCAAQTVEAYNRLFCDIAAKPELYDPVHILEECRRYLYTFARSDSAGLALELGARASFHLYNRPGGIHRPDPRLPAIWLCKARFVYGWHEGDPQLRALFLKMLDVRTGLFWRKKAFSEPQKAKLEAMFTNPCRHPALSERAFRFLRELHAVRSRELVRVFLDEAEWFLNVFPARAPDTLRVWMADFLSAGESQERRAVLAVASFLGGRSGEDTVRVKGQSSMENSVARSSRVLEDTSVANVAQKHHGLDEFATLLKVLEVDYRPRSEPKTGVLRIGSNRTHLGWVFLKTSGEIFFERLAPKALNEKGATRADAIRFLAEKAPSTLLGQLCRAVVDAGLGEASDDTLGLFSVNYFRRQVGLEPVRTHRAFMRAARAHAQYVAKHGGAHREDADKDGFTGTYPWNRVEHFGWRQLGGMGEVMGGTGNPLLDVVGWMFTLYHRYGVIGPSVRLVGWGNVSDGKHPASVLDYSMDFSGCRSTGDTLATWPKSNWILYPYDGQMDVPPGWDGLETPDPLPNINGVVGFPITAYPRCGLGNLELRSFALFALGHGREEPVKSVVFSADRFLQGFGLIPLTPLAHGRRYCAELKLHDTVVDTTFTLSWEFRTAIFGDRVDK